MHSVIYYFSGSGNSYKIAENISERLGDTKLIKISSENMHLALENDYKKVGIVFPDKKSIIKRDRYTHPEVKVGEMIK